ncbi:centrosomal protein of 55 kDa-like [Anneissia japonica]|uniref:centrosomal protein of 55 kDa-like n=1 Tax=Anneissia japonica TaxID=1529436 RepID=UPI0014257C01|nr:centrosomal protein of 55 kDa-like [Anneissia japonica]
MADYPTVKEIQGQLKDNLIYTQQAMLERDEAVSKLRGMRNLTSVLHATREDLHSYKEKSDTYELLLLRDESHIKKLKQLVTEKEKDIQKLKTALKDCGVEVDDDIETDGAGPETDKFTHSSKESGYQSVDDEISIYGRPSAEKSSIYGVSHEIYDQLLRDHIQLKKELDNLIEKGDIKPTQYLQDEENKEQITQLELSNKELKKKVKQLEKEVLDMNDVVKSGPDSNKSKVLELSAQLRHLHEKYRRQELLQNLLEEKCQELAQKLLEKSRQSGKTVDSKSDSKEDIKAKSSTDTFKESNHHGAGSSDLPLDEQLKDLEYRNASLSKHLQHSQKQNKDLSDKLKSAEKNSQIYEQRYQELLETFQAMTTEVDTKCEKCLVKDDAIETFKMQTEHLNAQLSVFQEDEKHTRKEISNLKKKHESEIDQWARNYSTLSDELEKMKTTLQAQKQHYERKLRSMVQVQPVLEPYQYRRPDSMDMGRRRPVDVCDEEPAPSNRHQNPAPPLQRTARLQDTAPFMDMLECPRCKREFPPSQQREHAIHVNRCLDD